MNNEIYLVTGAAGHLGNTICKKLIKKGKKVRGLVQKGDLNAKRLPPEVDIHFGDILDMESLEIFFATEVNTDVYVIHTDNVVAMTEDPREKIGKINVGETRNIVYKCISHQVKKLVYISSTSAIPEPKKGTPILEVNYYKPEAVVDYYGKGKAVAAQIVREAAKLKNLDASIVLPSIICGPEDYAFSSVTQFIIDVINGKISVGIKGNVNIVDVRDLAEGVISCCYKGKKGEGYIMGNDCVSIRELLQLISLYSGTKEIKKMMPLFFAKLMAYTSKLTAIILGRTNRLTPVVINNLSRNNQFCSKKAVKEIGYKTRSIEKTIADSILWLRSENQIVTEGIFYPEVQVNET